VRQMLMEPDAAQHLGQHVSLHLAHLDEELRLAARLQRDFLPKVGSLPEHLDVAYVYRPASWVSGDWFDVFQIDETRTGFCIADAVGHGVAAGLLTMFLRSAIHPPRARRGAIDSSPAGALTRLNHALIDQALPGNRFVTAWYGVLCRKTRELVFARGGHPYPLRLSPGGPISPLTSEGGLLGINPLEELEECRTTLAAGERLLLYTDGLEAALDTGGPDGVPGKAVHGFLRPLANLPVQTMIEKIEAGLDEAPGSLNPLDDVTIVAIQMKA